MACAGARFSGPGGGGSDGCRGRRRSVCQAGGGGGRSRGHGPLRRDRAGCAGGDAGDRRPRPARSRAWSTDGISTFRGLRYGAPPIGPLRWRPPQKPKPWTSVADCHDFGAPAMQMAGGDDRRADLRLRHADGPGVHHALRVEDPERGLPVPQRLDAGVRRRKRPVMVWIHGGGFAYGSGGQPIYECDGLARHGDVVAVSVNHRLNVFGYLYLGDLMGPDYRRVRQRRHAGPRLACNGCATTSPLRRRSRQRHHHRSVRRRGEGLALLAMPAPRASSTRPRSRAGRG